MIGRISGTLVYQGISEAIIDAGGVGYRVFITLDTAKTLSAGGQASLFTHLAVRENALDLYGFLSREELQFFELLLGVSGIGPKSALNIMNVATIEALRSAIHAGDASHLVKVSGIGKKTAEKIVLELREKIGPAELSPLSSTRAESDALEALHALGYSLSEARDALKQVPREVEGDSERLREALRLLGK